MRIAIVCGHFMPEVGYQEVYLARAYSRLGHEVQVITSNKTSPSAKNIKRSDYRIGLDRDDKYKFTISRIRPILKFGANIISMELKKALEEFHPDIVLVVGVGKIFPLPILRNSRNRKYKLVALFGDNKDFWNWSSVKHSLKSVKSIVLQKSIKNRLYAKAVESCDKLVLYTPETENIMLSYMPEKLKKELREKAILSTLGFDPDEFFFDEKDRENLRKAFGASKSEVVLITSTRVNRRKNIENVIDIISKLYIEGNKVRYIIIGFLGDNYEKEIKAYINKKPNPEIFHCYPFISHKEIRKLYCASDIGIWLKAAISIQEAMGTGLPVILENKLSVNHLIQEGINGWFFEKGKLVDIIKKAVSNMSNKSYEERIVQRKSIEKYNYERLSYDKIAQKIIDGIS